MFQRNPDRRRCPCQNLSDSGLAGETACEAAQDWHRPEHFRFVCPLIKTTPEGLRCSVDARHVRPFWGRASVFFAGGLFACYLLFTIGAFTFLRLIGYPLSPVVLVWPPRWADFPAARSEYYFAKAKKSLDEHRVNDAIFSLDIAYRSNTRNFTLGLQYAQLLSLGQPDYADAIFAKLMREHPGQATVIAEAWYRSLMVHGRFAQIATLSSSRLIDDADRRPAWLHALFFATRQLGNDAPLRALVSPPRKELPTIYTALINSELQIRQHKGAELLPGLTAELPADAGPYGPYFQISRLTQLGHPNEAAAMLGRYASANRLGQVDQLQLRLEILSALGRTDVLRARLDQGSVNAPELDIICTFLVRHPDPATLASLSRCVKRSKIAAEAANYPAFLAFYVTSTIGGDQDGMRDTAKILKDIAGSRVSRIESVETYLKQAAASGKIGAILPMLPGLSMDMIYALFDRFGAAVEQPTVTIRTSMPPK